MAKQDAIKEGIGLLEDWGEKLADVISEYGPDAAELALALGRAGATKEVATGLILLALAVAAATLAARWGCLGMKIIREDGGAYDSGAEPLVLLGGGLAGLASVLIGGSAISYLTNVYAWAGMFRPEIWLAAKALGWT